MKDPETDVGSLHVHRNHPGRQSPMGAGKRCLLFKTLAPSAVPLNIGNSWVARLARSIVFGTPQAMTGDQIDSVVAQFTRAACLASKAGFDGVEIHAGREYYFPSLQVFSQCHYHCYKCLLFWLT